MIKEVEDCGTDKEISIKATQKFQSIFKITDNRSKVACIRRANRWWKGKDQFLNALSRKESRILYVRSKNIPGLVEKRSGVKALHGRGRKRNDWVIHLHQKLLLEFERLSYSDVRLSRALILDVALTLLKKKNLFTRHHMSVQLLVDQQLSILQQNGLIVSYIASILSYVDNMELYIDHHRKQRLLKGMSRNISDVYSTFSNQNSRTRIQLKMWMKCTSYLTWITEEYSAFVEAPRLIMLTWLVDAMGLLWS